MLKDLHLKKGLDLVLTTGPLHSEQMSDFGDGKPIPDTIWFWYVQGLKDEWGYLSQAEIERLKPKTWEIPKKSLAYSGRRGRNDF